MRAYSDDLRLRIIEMIQLNEESQAAIAEHFSVSLPFVEKLWHRFRTTGKYQAKPFAGGVNGQSGGDDGNNVRRAAKIETAAQKKSLHACERESERVQHRRAEYDSQVKAEVLSKFKFLDEAGSNLAMTRLYGRAAKGNRVIETVAQNYGENTRDAGESFARGRGSPE